MGLASFVLSALRPVNSWAGRAKNHGSPVRSRRGALLDPGTADRLAVSFDFSSRFGFIGLP
jgi:hypothetical protein